MSEPTPMSEKAVWLYDNLATFFLCQKGPVLHDETDMLKDVVNIILARINTRGIEELFDYLIVHKIDGMSEDELDKSLKDADVDPISVMERVEKMVTVPEASTVVESVLNGITQAYIAGMKAQKDYDK